MYYVLICIDFTISCTQWWRFLILMKKSNFWMRKQRKEKAGDHVEYFIILYSFSTLGFLRLLIQNLQLSIIVSHGWVWTAELDSLFSWALLMLLLILLQLQLCKRLCRPTDVDVQYIRLQWTCTCTLISNRRTRRLFETRAFLLRWP